MLLSFLFFTLNCSEDHAFLDATDLDFPALISLPLPNGMSAGGIAFDGTYFWVTAQSYIDHDRFYRIDQSGNRKDWMITKRQGNPNGGLTFDGKYLYNLNYKTNNGGLNSIDRFSTDGDFIDSRDAAGSGYNTNGLTWAGGTFFQGIYEGYNSILYELDEELSVISETMLPFRIDGLTWDGEKIWISTGERYRMYTYQNGDIQDSYDVGISLKDIQWVDGDIYGVEKNSSRIHRIKMDE